MLLLIANHRNAVLLAFRQYNNLKPTIQTLISEWVQKIIAIEVASSHTVSNGRDINKVSTKTSR